MNNQLSPFAALTGAEKQIRWLEYQSIRLPYVAASPECPLEKTEPEAVEQTARPAKEETTPLKNERPVPPPEVPRTLPADYNRARHTQYDAVIARMKQAELQARQRLHSSQ